MTLKTNILLTILSIMVSTAAAGQDVTGGKYIEHTVKWYEDLDDVSARYGVPEDVIISVNKLQGRTLRTRQILLIPTDSSVWENLGKDAEVDGQSDTVSDSAEDAQELAEERKVRFTLLLPLTNEDGSANENNMDFYCGVLMAVKQAGEEGTDVELNVIDYKYFKEDYTGIGNSDFVIGPIRSDDIEHTLASLKDSTVTLISPLDTKASRIAENDSRLVQASASVSGQYDEAARWALECGREHQNVRYILVGGENDSLSLHSAIESFRKACIPHSVCMTGVQGEIEGWEESSLRADAGHNVVLLAISNEAVLNNAVRNMSIYISEGNLTVLAGNRIRSYETIPEESIHKAEVHAVCPYYVDYSDERTLSFIHRYRPLFNNEPSQFSYQGYDLTYIAVKLCSKYGKTWMEKASEEDCCNMLQTSFKFVRKEGGGYVNCGMRRIVYRPDFSISLENGN